MGFKLVEAEVRESGFYFENTLKRIEWAEKFVRLVASQQRAMMVQLFQKAGQQPCATTISKFVALAGADDHSVNGSAHSSAVPLNGHGHSPVVDTPLVVQVVSAEATPPPLDEKPSRTLQSPRVVEPMPRVEAFIEVATSQEATAVPAPTPKLVDPLQKVEEPAQVEVSLPDSCFTFGRIVQVEKRHDYLTPRQLKIIKENLGLQEADTPRMILARIAAGVTSILPKGRRSVVGDVRSVLASLKDALPLNSTVQSLLEGKDFWTAIVPAPEYCKAAAPVAEDTETSGDEAGAVLETEDTEQDAALTGETPTLSFDLDQTAPLPDQILVIAEAFEIQHERAPTVSELRKILGKMKQLKNQLRLIALLRPLNGNTVVAAALFPETTSASSDALEEAGPDAKSLETVEKEHIDFSLLEPDDVTETIVVRQGPHQFTRLDPFAGSYSSPAEQSREHTLRADPTDALLVDEVIAELPPLPEFDTLEDLPRELALTSEERRVIGRMLFDAKVAGKWGSRAFHIACRTVCIVPKAKEEWRYMATADFEKAVAAEQRATQVRDAAIALLHAHFHIEDEKPNFEEILTKPAEPTNRKHVAAPSSRFDEAIAAEYLHPQPRVVPSTFDQRASLQAAHLSLPTIDISGIESHSRNGNVPQNPAPQKKSTKSTYFDDDALADEFEGAGDSVEEIDLGELVEYEPEDFAALGIDPYKPTRAAPGSEKKVLMLSARYAAGLPMWHEQDLYSQDLLAKAGLLGIQDDHK